MKAEDLEKIAYHDTLTGCYNRSAYEEEIMRSIDDPHGISAVIFDINDLKHCNDHYGHEKGDYLIQSVAFVIDHCFKNNGKYAGLAEMNFVF